MIDEHHIPSRVHSAFSCVRSVLWTSMSKTFIRLYCGDGAPAFGASFLLEHACGRWSSSRSRIAATPLTLAHLALDAHRHHVEPEQPVELVGRDFVLEAIRRSNSVCGRRTLSELLEHGAQLDAILAKRDTVRFRDAGGRSSMPTISASRSHTSSASSSSSPGRGPSARGNGCAAAR